MSPIQFEPHHNKILNPIDFTGGPGRPAIVHKHPEIIGIVREYITQCGSKAHNRRRDDKQYLHGASLENIRREVLRKVPALKEISTDTIHRILEPPHKSRSNRKRYRSLVNARVPAKKNNDVPNPHTDTHYCRAVVDRTLQLASQHNDEVISASLDNKNKVPVGTLAVSRFYKHRKFFPNQDAPDYPNHDFPFKRSKLIPAGYKRLMFPRRSRSESRRSNPTSSVVPRRSRSVSPLSHTETCDRVGRRHTKWPRNGPLELFLYAMRHHKSTSSVHSRHLRSVIPKWQGVEKLNSFVAITDGGPDYNPDKMINVINFGRLWKALDLDVFLTVCYAGGDSALNAIERGWSFISSLWTGVTLPVCLPGEDLPPWKQSWLTEAEKESKTDEVFFNANSDCIKYLYGKKYAGFDINAHADNFRGDEEIAAHDALISMLNKVSRKKLATDDQHKEFQKEYQFLISHCVRRFYYLQFKKCTSPSCSHCSINKATSTNFLRALDELGGSIPPPTQSSIYKRHYVSLDELRVIARGKTFFEETQPSFKSLGHKKCPHCRDFSMFTQAEQDRHYLWMGHNTETTATKTTSRVGQKRRGSSSARANKTKGGKKKRSKKSVTTTTIG